MSVGAGVLGVVVWVLGWTAAVVAWVFPRPRTRRPFPSRPQGLRAFDPARGLSALDPRTVPTHHPTRPAQR